MVIRKVIKTNTLGAVGVNIPAEMAKTLKISSNSYVSIENEGESLVIKKVVMKCEKTQA